MIGFHGGLIYPKTMVTRKATILAAAERTLCTLALLEVFNRNYTIIN